jgi:hypothetical protein
MCTDDDDDDADELSGCGDLSGLLIWFSGNRAEHLCR